MTRSLNALMKKSVFSRVRYAFLLSASVFAAGTGLSTAHAAELAQKLPAPALDQQNSQGATPEVAVLAGGCFWGVQGVFQHVKGVTNAVSGYAGGDKKTAHYEIVGSGSTGHAESVEVTYDPRQISYGRLLQLFFSVAHDPTQLNRQGPDAGTQYRSAIFPKDAEQARLAKAYIAQLNQAGISTPRLSRRSNPIAASMQPRATIRIS